jgi:pyruvate-ferredoxin/flavodoxin oxidoreductase
MPLEEAVAHMKEAVQKSYGKKGANVVAMNNAAVDAGIENLREVKVPADWADAADGAAVPSVSADENEVTRYVREILVPTAALRSESLPVSKFVDIADGRLPSGTAAYEKRGIAVEVPIWKPENCIQCNWCSMACPPAAIRPFVMNDWGAAVRGC